MQQEIQVVVGGGGGDDVCKSSCGLIYKTPEGGGGLEERDHRNQNSIFHGSISILIKIVPAFYF